MRFLIILVTLCLCISTQAQNNKLEISGKIINEENKPISQALIAIEGTSTGTYSDENGYFQLNISSGKQTFTVSAYGYKTQTIKLDITASAKRNFKLEKNSVNLSEVEVHGKSKVQELRESGFSVNAIDVKTYTNSLNNLNDLIGRSSGIKIREDGGVGADFDLSINGLSGNSVRYFIDGVPLSSIGNGVTLANIPVNLVDRVEVYKGVVPTELGLDALGGAINIITKKDIKNYLDVSYGMGSFGTYKADLNANYVDSKTGIFIRPIVGFNHSKNNYTMKDVQVPNEERDGFKIINAKRFHDRYTSFLGQVNIGVEGKKWADILSFTASYSHVDKELQTGSDPYKVYGMATRKNKAFNISAQYKKNNFLTSKLSTELSISQTWDYSIVTDTAFRKYDWTGNYIYAQRNEILGRGKSIRHVDRPLTIGRANFNYLLNNNHAFNLNYLMDKVTNKREDDFDTEFVPSKDDLSKHVIGLSYKQSFWHDKLSNTFFVKDYISHLKVGQRDLSWITGSDKIPASSTTNNWGYGASVRFRFANWIAIKASAERTSRLPLTREYMGNGVEVYPNFLLKPENSRNYNAGLFGTIMVAPQHRLFYETSVFYRGVKDYIRYVRTAEDGTGQYQNVASVNVKGAEGEIRYEYNNCLQVIANISYVEEINKTKYKADGKPDIAYNDQIPNKPWFYGNAEVNYTKQNILGKQDSRLRASYYFQYVHWFYLDWKNYASTQSNKEIPSQYIHNLSLTYSLKNEKYNLSLELNNIFDRLTYDNYMMQKPGRSFFCKLRVFIN